MASLKQLVRAFLDQLTFDGLTVLDNFAPQLGVFLAVVVPCLLALLLYRRRLVRLGKAERLFPRMLVLNAALVCVVLGVLLITLSPRPEAFASRTDLIPFHPLWSALTGEVDATLVAATFGANVVLFIPLGILLPLRWPALDSGVLVTLVSGLLAGVIESLQYVMDLGRVTQVDDVIFNAMGGLIGWIFLRTASMVFRWFRPVRHA